MDSTAADDPWLPADIEAPSTKLVYLCLRVEDGVTVDDLKRRTDLPKLTIHGVLRTLRRTQHVEAEDGRYYVAAREDPAAKSAAD